MVQCDPMGRCQNCLRMNNSQQCGYKSYPTQRVNCTWDVDTDRCLPNLVEMERITVQGMLAPRRAHDSAVQGFYNRCPAIKYGKNCTNVPYCKNVPVEHDYTLNYCQLNSSTDAYADFWLGLGYDPIWVNKSATCDSFWTQYHCLHNGCFWVYGKCTAGMDYTCSVQCNKTYPQRMEYAYSRQLNLQCGDPCDTSESQLLIGAAGKAYDIADRVFAEAVCGPVCNADKRCVGFNAVGTIRRCYYRRSTTCYVRQNPDRDCYSKKAQCNTLQCPPGYLPLPDEVNSFCLGKTCSVANDLDACCGKALCTDMENWVSKTTCRDDGFKLGQGCTSQGWTCKAYEIWGWCKPSHIARGVIVPGSEWALGEDYNSPTENCCICGGGIETLPNVDYGPEPPELSNVTENPPGEHLCCVGLDVGREHVRAVLPEPLNVTAMRRWDCMDPSLNAATPAGAACSYCMCLFDDGADFLKHPQCCSLRRSSTPGIDSISGQPFCTKYMPRYNLLTERVRSCELRYDLYLTSGATSSFGFKLVLVACGVLGLIVALL
eukprot:TRINITY_DN13787_c0_g1_i1.p1 TRINITY_DN13787_c0_g1~~TRINITY_DN13787_c0_g1_i1.p1  ORF type:complete len:635 (-),score=64.32 TRINITY_DN13787_c0_g1_i1:74-1708(-)